LWYYSYITFLSVIIFYSTKICFASVSSGIRAMCPNRDRRLDWTVAERWGCLVNLLTSDLDSAV